MKHEKALQAAVNESNSTANPNFSGRWINQMNSTMDLTVNGSDVTGSYTSSTSSTGSGGGPITGSLKGYVSGDLISFLVLWPGGSMTAWVGQLVDDQANARIKTLWHLVTEIPNNEEPSYLWLSIFTGADEFRR